MMKYIAERKAPMRGHLHHQKRPHDSQPASFFLFLELRYSAMEYLKNIKLDTE
jgi:hypothetical protein